jgi:DNA-3-methyladenine glycosylase II
MYVYSLAAHPFFGHVWLWAICTHPDRRLRADGRQKRLGRAILRAGRHLYDVEAGWRPSFFRRHHHPLLASVVEKAILERLSSADPKLGRLIAEHGSFAINPTGNLFQAIAESIMAQQLAWAAASTIIKRFKELYPGKDFPSPQDVVKTPFDKLRSVGLSRAKATYIQDLASKILDGSVDPLRLADMSDQEVINHLTAVKGIGRWTAEMVLLFDLGRLDVLPVDDLGVRKGFQRIYGLKGLPKPEQMIKIAEKWRPYRSVGTWYMWKAMDTKPPIG